jgi:hypothetical protein
MPVQIDIDGRATMLQFGAQWQAFPGVGRVRKRAHVEVDPNWYVRSDRASKRDVQGL